ncbi:phospholipid-binding protein [Purpureocillium lavendulum]|uniref:Phospholipid-binding protein n=1 Tax=Purpureocillium lavendulum TaxID=1247861 RepID=A0AB34G624_9HYPO|nr:phospholipid-binding protein [Purpureocillium lavendulum]
MNSTTTRPLISSWSPTPIPNLTLSAGGLLALADLNTVAQRTVISGGSSWLDAFVLAPGLHYQQAADALFDQHRPPPASGDGSDGDSAIDGDTQARFPISNRAMVNYLRRLWQEVNETGTLTLDVGMLKEKTGKEEIEQLRQTVRNWWRGRRSRPAQHQAEDLNETDVVQQRVEVDWLSHLFYLASPLLTVASLTFMILLADWWGLAFLVALMISRVLNIWSIKQRSRPSSPPSRPRPLPRSLVPSESAPPTLPDRRTSYAIELGGGRRAVLRGMDSDLRALTTQTWLRDKSTLDGYLEAAAKLLVYLVAAFSGNLSQAGAIVLMSLLLVSAGLLGLSNAHARELRMNGRVARLSIERALNDRRKRGQQHQGNGTRLPA